MFREIFLFDLRRNFKKPSTYIYFSVFFALTLMLGLVAAGVFDIASGDSNIKANAANTIADIIVSLNDGVLGLVNSIILVAIFIE
jgi:ABC-2 type transport system permease protein